MLQPIFLHLDSDAGMENRFDTVMMVNGSIAALCRISRQLGLDPVAIDGAYPGPDYLRQQVRQEIETALSQGHEPIIFCTVLSYNAAGSLQLLRELKSEYGSRLRTGVGGQLVRVAPQAYRSQWFIDHVGVGDAEVVLPALLNGQPFAAGYLHPQMECDWSVHYATPDYTSYSGLSERLNKMATYHLGPFTDIRQLVVETTRGCAWAYENATCAMCSLEGINNRPIPKPNDVAFAFERELLERYGVNWLFDVSNQWLPSLQHKTQWLQSYVAARQAAGLSEISKFVYLTSNSIDSATAPLLRQAGVRIAYVGIDGWDTESRTGLGKPRSIHLDEMVAAAQAAGIYLRSSIVIGENLTHDSLDRLRSFVQYVANNHGQQFISFGCFLEIILQGSPVWNKLRGLAQKGATPKLRQAARLYDKMDTCGFLTWDEQRELTNIYIDETQAVTAAEAEAVRDETEAIIHSSGIVGVTIEHGGQLAR